MLLESLIVILVIYITGVVANASAMIVAVMIRIRRGDDFNGQAGAIGSAILLSGLSWFALIFLGVPRAPFHIWVLELTLFHATISRIDHYTSISRFLG